MVSQAELIIRIITLWFQVLSQSIFLETVWVPLKLRMALGQPAVAEEAGEDVIIPASILKLMEVMFEQQTIFPPEIHFYVFFFECIKYC